MILYEVGKEYWTIAKRYHSHRDNPLMGPVAVRDMLNLLQSNSSPAVLRRINAFIARNHRHSPGNLPPNDGPKRA